MNIATIPVHPLAAKLPALKKHEYAMLKASMADRGFDKAFPVVVWNDPKLGPCIIGGRHRREIAVELGLDHIPVRTFEGDAEAVTKFVAQEQLGRRNMDGGARSFLMADSRKALGLTLEQAAEMAGVSISQQEKASAVAHKSASFTAKGIRGEISPSRAANKLKRTTPETHTEGEDPKLEIERTTDRMKAAIDALIEWQTDYWDDLLDRRGAEQLKASLTYRAVKNGQVQIGLSMVDGVIHQIRRNMMKQWCKTCNGAGCQDCGDRRYVTAHELAMAKSQERT